MAGILILGALTALFVNTKLYDREVSTYANDAILAIVMDWDEQALLRRASPELFAASTSQQIHDAFVNYRQLGRMTKYNVARSIAHVNVEFALVHKKVTAVYIAKAAFQHGIAEIKLSLVKRNGRWHITGLHVTADELDTSSLLPEGQRAAPLNEIRARASIIRALLYQASEMASVTDVLAGRGTNGLRLVATLQTAASSFRIAAMSATLRGFPLETKRS